jgi:release factor glutamine methyltransferase
MEIREWTRKSAAQLRDRGVDSPQLDAEILAAFVLQTTREWLAAHGETLLTDDQIAQLNRLLKRRLRREPVAYLTQTKEFYGRPFLVNPQVLVPRPESEQLIELTRAILPDQPRIWDVGTGSGALAITAALEWPKAHVCASDISPGALAVARRNARRLHANVQFWLANLLQPTAGAPDIATEHLDQIKPNLIIANLPYVDPAWQVDQTSPELNFEPDLALYANDHGLQLIKQLIQQAALKIAESGYLILELDPVQTDTVSQFAIENGWKVIKTQPYALVLQKA